VVQTTDGETCDDGNSVSGCDVVHKQKPLDPCQNSCTLAICADPARITLTKTPNVLKFHGRLILNGQPLDLESDMLVIELTNGGTVVFRSSLLQNTIRASVTGNFLYRNKNAKTLSGIARVRARPARDSYKLLVEAYGDLGSAVSDMTVHIYVGTSEWAGRGLWQRTHKGWCLNASSILLQP
jgi:hypothetical protein